MILHARRLAAAGFAASLAARVALAASSDSIPATGGPITITPINHATVQIAHGTHTILVDPTSQGSYTGLPTANLILITDIHPDHLDPKALAQVRKGDVKVVAPSAAASQLPGATIIANGETKTVDGVSVEAVAMYNLERGPAAGQLYHEKGRGNGYVLTLGGKRIYLSGDTECTPEMKALKNIDVAFMTMNLPYTMPPSEAAECVKAFKPKMVYPYHSRGSNIDEFTGALKGTGIDIRVRDWYAPASPSGR